MHTKGANVAHSSSSARWTPAADVALVGLFVRRPRWGLSLAGKCLLLAIIIAVGCLAAAEIHPFLAVTNRVDADVLVVEGWVHPYALQAAVKEFNAHDYQLILSTGGPVVGKGGYVNDFQTAASFGAERLKKLVVPTEAIQMVPSRVSDRDRTYSSAVALKDWFLQRGMTVHAINIVTEDVHARRTRLLFRRALGPEVKIGIIAVANPDYDSRRWWRSSEGIEGIMSEAISYVYAMCFLRTDAARFE